MRAKSMRKFINSNTMSALNVIQFFNWTSALVGKVLSLNEKRRKNAWESKSNSAIKNPTSDSNDAELLLRVSEKDSRFRSLRRSWSCIGERVFPRKCMKQISLAEDSRKHRLLSIPFPSLCFARNLFPHSFSENFRLRLAAFDFSIFLGFRNLTSNVARNHVSELRARVHCYKRLTGRVAWRECQTN